MTAPTALVIPHPTPDLAHAERFLTRLDEGATGTDFFCFQTFDDLKTRKDKSLARIFHGTLDTVHADLQRLQWRRAGVYVTVNATDGKGRTLANMVRPRAVWCEWDRSGEPLPAWPLEPHMTVETSPGKFHLYWLGADLEWADFDALMQVMVAWGSDPNARDRSRVLRLPGFWHQKHDTPFQVRIVAESLALPYSRAELLVAFPVTSAPTAAPPSDLRGSPSDDMACMATVVRLAGEHAAKTWADPKAGRHSQIMSLGHELESRGIPGAFDVEAVRRFEAAMRPTNTSGVVEPLHFEAEMKALLHGRLTARDAPTVVHGAAVADALIRKRAKALDEKIDLALERALERANGRGPEYAPVPQAETPIEPIPVPLLARLEADLNRRVHIAHPLAAQQAALAVAAHAAARQGLSMSGDPCSLYLALCAQSVGLMRPYLAEVSKIFEAAGLKKSVRPTRISTPTSLYKLLYAQPSLLYLSAEYGSMLQFAKRQPAGTLEMALNALSELHDAADLPLDLAELGIKEIGADQDVLRSPTVNLLALVSQEQMAAVAKASELGRGALEQTQVILLDEDRLFFNDPEDICSGEFDPALIATIRRLRRAADLPLAGVRGYQSPDFIRVRWGADMKDVYPALDDLAAGSARAARPLLIAARSHIRRVSTVLALWANPDEPIITREILSWAARRETGRLRAFLAQFDLLSSDDGKTSVLQKVLAAICGAKHHGITARELQQQCWAYRSLSKEKRDECLDLLVEDGDVVGIVPDGKRVKSYFGSHFVKLKGAGN